MILGNCNANSTHPNRIDLIAENIALKSTRVKVVIRLVTWFKSVPGCTEYSTSVKSLNEKN